MQIRYTNVFLSILISFLFIMSCNSAQKTIDTQETTPSNPYESLKSKLDFVCLPIAEKGKNEFVRKYNASLSLFLVDGKEVIAKANICNCEKGKTIIKTRDKSIQMPVWLNRDTVHVDSCHYYTMPIVPNVCIAMYTYQNHHIKMLKDGTNLYMKNGKKVRAIGNFCKCLSEGTLIATPNGNIPIEDLKIGDQVFTSNGYGEGKIIRPILQISKVEVPEDYKMVNVKLIDGRRITLSYNHPLSIYYGFKPIEQQLSKKHGYYPNERIDTFKEVIYTKGYTYDILPDSRTGEYWANDIRLGSTLFLYKANANNEPLIHSKTHSLREFSGECCTRTTTITTQLTTNKNNESFKIESFNDLPLKDLVLDFKKFGVDTVTLVIKVRMDERNHELITTNTEMSFRDKKGKLLQDFSLSQNELNQKPIINSFPFSIKYTHDGKQYRTIILKPETQETIAYP